jgi:hypothetical protein
LAFDVGGVLSFGVVLLLILSLAKVLFLVKFSSPMKLVISRGLDQLFKWMIDIYCMIFIICFKLSDGDFLGWGGQMLESR